MDRFRGVAGICMKMLPPIFMRYASGHSGIMRFFARRH